MDAASLALWEGVVDPSSAFKMELGGLLLSTITPH